MLADRPDESNARAGVDPRPLILVGGGEHAGVVADAARSSKEWEIAGVVDSGTPRAGLVRIGVVHLGDEQWLLERLSVEEDEERPWLVVSVGGVVDGSARRAVAGRLGHQKWASVVHSAAWVSPTAVIGPGAVVMAGGIVNAGARLGQHVILNTGAVVEHDVRVDDFARIAPGVVIGGGTHIGEDAMVGLGARVRDHLTVGAGAVVAMGAVVTTDVPPGAKVAGVPARVVD